jgi:hypothetical protein
MTTNTNTKPAARFFASATANDEGLYTITDRTDGLTVAAIKGRAAARTMAATLTAIDPAPRADDDVQAEAKAEGKRTSHADCAHAATKLARAICRRERAKAETPADAEADA